MSAKHAPKKNFLLEAMPAAEFKRIAPHLELVSFEKGDVLYEFEEKLKYGYFPTTLIASLLCSMEDGVTAEVAVVGREGVLGESIFMGGKTALTQASVQHEGEAYRLKSSILKEEFDHCGALQHLLMRYTQTLIVQMAQTTGCNRRHTAEQQLSRWLLLNIDRLASHKVSMTQESLANVLGVRRETITDVAGKMQESGVISYSRGLIEIIDRTKLEALSCECYDIVKKQYDDLLAELAVKEGRGSLSKNAGSC